MNLTLPRAFGCLAVLGMLHFNSAIAQTCPGGGAQLVQTYNTTKVGNANNVYTLAKFDPTIGTLYSAEVKSVIYFTYSYTLTNIGVAPENYTVNIYRDDIMSAYSPSHPSPLVVFNETFFRQYKYQPGLGTGVPVGNTNYSNNVMYPRTLTQVFNQSVVPFLGNDSLYINYTTSNEAQTTISNPNVAISNIVTYDSILLQVKYNYCPTATLPSKLLTISSKLQNSNVAISWLSEDRYSEGYFELLKSTDGKTYKSINRQPIDKNNTGDYSYLYAPSNTDGTTGFFRIRQTNTNGDILYSRVATVGLPQKNNVITTPLTSNVLTVFPTVAGGSVNLVLPNGNANDEWQLSVLSLSGQVLQNSVVKGNRQVRLTFNNPLPNGMHIISAFNKRTNITYKGKIIVQH